MNITATTIDTMSFSTIPNEIILDIADMIPARELSVLSQTNSTLSHLLTPLLLRRVQQLHLQQCIILDRPDSLRAILRPPYTHLSLDFNMAIPRDRVPQWPLHYAALYCSRELVATIIELGVPVDDPEEDTIPDRATTLQWTVISGKVTKVTIVLNAGADINRTSDQKQSTPLSLACDRRDYSVANLLIDRGAKLGADELTRAASTDMFSVMERMLDLGVLVDSIYYSKIAEHFITTLQYLCLLGYRKFEGSVEILLRRGADPNLGIKGPMFPLYNCITMDSLRIARLLLDFGADRGAEYGGKSMTEVAQIHRNQEMVELLQLYKC